MTHNRKRSRIIAIGLGILMMMATLGLWQSAATAATLPAGTPIIGPGCNGQWNATHVDADYSGTWPSVGGDYVGTRTYQGGGATVCTGNTHYILDGTQNTAVFRWHFEVDVNLTTSCHIWAYIPTQNAGDRHARYDFWQDGGLGDLHWLGWPGKTIDQENTSGWTDLGSVTVPLDTYMLTITLNNQDTQDPGWYAGAGDMAINCSPTPSFNSHAAANDLINHIDGTPQAISPAPLYDSAGHRMDTLKVIEPTGIEGGRYLAVYYDTDSFTGGYDVMLAESSDLMNWTYVTTLDYNASQPYLAQATGGSFVLAEEHNGPVVVGTSYLKFYHFDTFADLVADNPDASYNPQTNGIGTNVIFDGDRTEGTPDIHGLSADGYTVDFGFHWNDGSLDREAYGHLSGLNTPSPNLTPVKDTVRDDSVTARGYPETHGDRDDIVWHGYRFSLQEAELPDTQVPTFQNFRYVLYDYQTHQTYAVPLDLHGLCNGNPSITLLHDPSNALVLAIGVFSFTSSGCGGKGPFLYTVKATV
jgi:hypothetical protein